MRSYMRISAVLIVALAVALPALAQDAYCSITEVTTKALSNGASVTIEADGLLQHRVQSWGKTDTINIYLRNARSALADDLIRPKDVYPISFVRFTVPQSARNGIGLTLTIQLSDRMRFEIPEQSDQQKLIINIKTERTVPGNGRNGGDDSEDDEGDTEDEEEEEEEEEKLTVSFDDGGLTVRALKADLHRVVAEIARAAGVNIAVDDRVQREVSLNCSALGVNQVLQAIASGYGLALSAVGDVQMLSEGIPTDLPTYGRSVTASYPLTYVKVDDAASLLPPFLIEYLRRNPQQNSIVVTAPRQMLDKIGEDLRAIDIAPPLIMIEVLAVEITNDGSLDRSLEAMYVGKDFETGINTETGAINHSDGDSYGLAGGIAQTIALSGRVRALLASGVARIKAQPRMAAMNGQRANMFIGRDRFIRMTYSQYGVQQEKIETVRVGVSLNIRPWTGGNGEITTSVDAEVSNIVDIDPETGIPRLSTRKASASVRTRDGETIIIGGLTQRQVERVERRIPLLGDIPIIGELFRSTSSRVRETELVIFLTPRLIEAETAADITEAAAEATG